MPGRLRTASKPSRMVMEDAPYSSGAFFFGAATVETFSLGVAANGPVTAAGLMPASLPLCGLRTDFQAAFLRT